MRKCKKCKNKWLFLLAVFVSLLIVVQILFSIQTSCKWLEAVWNAGDFIPFVGTIVLGYVAVSQTEKANKMSEQLMEIEVNRYKLEIRPFVMVINWSVYEIEFNKLIFNPDKLYIKIGEYSGEKDALCLSLILQNTTESYLSIEYFNGVSQDIKLSNSTTNQYNRKLCLLAGESKEIVFYADYDFIKSLEGKNTTLEFILENRFAEKYKEIFEIIITSLSDIDLSKNSKWHCSLMVQKYQIGKFIKDKDGKVKLKMEEQINGEDENGISRYDC